MELLLCDGLALVELDVFSLHQFDRFLQQFNILVLLALHVGELLPEVCQLLLHCEDGVLVSQVDCMNTAQFGLELVHLLLSLV